MRGCEVASETCVQINKEGVLAIQHQVVDENSRPSFIDFILAPLLEDDEYEYESQSVNTSQEDETAETSQDTDEEEGFRRRTGGGDGRKASSPLKSYSAPKTTDVFSDDDSTEDEL